MRRKVLAVDFDDVVLDFNRSFLASHNFLYGTNLTYDQLVRYDDWEIMYGSDKETMIERALNFYNSPEHKLVRPVPGAPEAIKELANDYSLHIVTSRPEGVRESTLTWIEQHFNEVFDDFHFTNIFAGKKEHKPIAKSEVCHKIGAVALIDDALRHAHDVSQSGIPVLLPDRPWNQGEIPQGVHRMNSWVEATQWIKENL